MKASTTASPPHQQPAAQAPKPSTAQSPTAPPKVAQGDGPDVMLSVVVPVFNEEETIKVFLDRVEPILQLVCAPQAYEIVFVDDGSRDRTVDAILSARGDNPSVRLVRLSRNFGKDIALTAGIDHAVGAGVIPMDVDLQDPPEVIPAMVEAWRNGNDVVYATRARREGDGPLKRFSARWFYTVHNWLADVPIPHDTGDFRLMDRRVVEALKLLPERNRFMKGLFTWVGFKQTGIEYERAARAVGDSKWRYWKLWTFALDGITASSTAPLRIWGYLGAFIALGSFAYAMVLVIQGLLFGSEVPGYTSLMVAVLFMGGINLLTLGIIGEYLGRTYAEVKSRPLYLVSERHGVATAPAVLPVDQPTVPAQDYTVAAE